jgi:photosystem II stability/assembly factor-like uncharacterized protein
MFSDPYGALAAVVGTLLLAAGCTIQGTSTGPMVLAMAPSPSISLPAGAVWKKLNTPAFRGKQDDIFFVDVQTGWYVNGEGKIYKTTDSGATWVEKLSKPGTYFRTIAFIDEKTGFAGNIGTDYFPGVIDTTPLYRTDDGGDTWRVAHVDGGAAIKGLCAIDVVSVKFINAGVLDERTVVHAGGRVGGPAHLMRSLDGGKTWTTKDLSAVTAAILDVKFFDDKTGFIMGASAAGIETSSARILKTIDGGQTWQTVYESKRPYEITWKASFPTRDVGYVTVQSYNPEKSVAQRVVAKTTDGGETWRELPLVNDFDEREFGVAFASAQVGWVGTLKGGYQTTDGGATWTFVEMGRAVNKIRVVRDGPQGFVGFAIGAEVRRLDAR